MDSNTIQINEGNNIGTSGINFNNSQLGTTIQNQGLSSSGLVMGLGNEGNINVNAQKTPIILLGDEKQKLTLENLYQEYDGNQPIIYGDADLITNEAFKSIRVDAPYVAGDITAYKKEIWNEFLSFIGVNTIDVEKKERLIKGESNANNEYINLNLQSYLIPRQKAAEEFNKLFGLTGDKKVEVKVRSDLLNLIKQEESVIKDYKDDGKINNSVEEVDLNE